MLEQIHDSFPVKINKYGCYFFSLLAMAENYSSGNLDAATILNIYDTCVDNGIMDEDCYVMAPDAILKTALKKLPSVPGKIIQVGIKDGEGERFWNWVKTKDYNYIIKSIKTSLNNKHFYLCDKNKVKIFEPNSKVKEVKQLSLVYYKVFV